MADYDDGGPAYPRAGDEMNPPVDGMTMADVAAIEITAALAERIVFDQPTEDWLLKEGIKTDDFEAYTAHIAYGFADALVAEKRRRESAKKALDA
jgi:hypothetical protein